MPNGEIALGQAFFARAISATTFTFTNALRVEANPATVARPVADARPLVRLTLAYTAPGAVADETVIYAEAGASRGEDRRFDGLRPGRNPGTVPTLASLIDGREAAVNGLPVEALTSGTTVVELTAALPVAGAYLLTAVEIAHLPTGTTTALLDRKLNLTMPLTTGTSYQLTAPTAGEVMTGRFALVFHAGRVTGLAFPEAPAAKLVVYPNPAAAGTTAHVAGGSPGTLLTVFDATGRRIVAAVTDAAGAAVLQLASLPAGVYGVRAADGRTTRLIVE